jgi:hypothetical protein
MERKATFIKTVEDFPSDSLPLKKWVYSYPEQTNVCFRIDHYVALSFKLVIYVLGGKIEYHSLF